MVLAPPEEQGKSRSTHVPCPGAGRSLLPRDGEVIFLSTARQYLGRTIIRLKKDPLVLVLQDLAPSEKQGKSNSLRVERAGRGPGSWRNWREYKQLMLGGLRA